MMTNAAKQRRHRLYKKRAIRWFEKATGFSLKEVMDIMKFYDLELEKKRRKDEPIF